MTLFYTTLNQTAFLLLFIAIGYLFAKWKVVSEHTAKSLSVLENNLFIPALMLETFISNFTVQKVQPALEIFAFSLVVEAFVIILSLLIVHFGAKGKPEKDFYLYGLCFSNFGFMGNAVVSVLFPDIFLEYLLFTLPLWVVAYLWGVPSLLITDGSKKPSIRQRLRDLFNPMVICMIIGMLIGILDIPIPNVAMSVISSAADCMSPLAMLVSGMIIAQFDLKEILKCWTVYLFSALRLLAFPLLFLAVMLVHPLQRTFAICAVCILAMPFGLNTVIIPSAYDKEVKDASGMVLVSHVLSCLTIPLIFWLFEKIC